MDSEYNTSALWIIIIPEPAYLLLLKVDSD